MPTEVTSDIFQTITTAVIHCPRAQVTGDIAKAFKTREGLKKTAVSSVLLTLEQSSTTSNNIKTTDWSDSKDLKEDFAYLLEMGRSVIRSHGAIRNCIIRLSTQICHKFMEFGQPDMIATLPTIFTSFYHKHQIHDFDQLIHNTFKTVEWREALKGVEKSYGTYSIDYKNPLLTKDTSQKIDVSTALHLLKTEKDSMSQEERQYVLGELAKSYEDYAECIVENKGALPEPNNETLATKTQSVIKRSEQLKTPQYRIEDDHKRRQAIVTDGLQTVIDVFTELRDHVISEIPIQTDEQAYLWRDGFMDLANNFTALGDDKHRMDFAGWAQTLKNIQLYGAEKGLKMSGSTITKKDIDMIDENTLPLKHYPQYGQVGISYISKEHLDSKGVIIANCFIDMMNRFGSLSAAADIFSSYQAKIRGIRALAVSHKLSDKK